TRRSRTRTTATQNPIFAPRIHPIFRPRCFAPAFAARCPAVGDCRSSVVVIVGGKTRPFLENGAVGGPRQRRAGGGSGGAPPAPPGPAASRRRSRRRPVGPS